MANLGIGQIPFGAGRASPYERLFGKANASKAPAKRQQSLKTPGQHLPVSAHLSPRFRFGHIKCLSNSSLRFAETVKTASFNKAGISIRSGSHKLTFSTKTRGNRSNNVRYSIDSDHPITRPSLDEGHYVVDTHADRFLVRC
jgi:hypothetical protein